MSTINLAGGNTLLTGGSFSPVRAASTGSPLNPATGGLLMVDGVQLAAGDRVLCKDESSAVNNGIYAAATGPWTRVSDAATNTQFFQGMTVTCGPQGAVNAGQTFVCTCTDDPVVVGTSPITWASQSAVQTATQTATSTTSLTIGTGSKTLAIQSGKSFQAGQWVLIQEASVATNQMLGTITSYSGTSLTVTVTATGGSGTHADWTIVLTNSAAAAGYQPPVGSGNVTGPGSATDGNLAVFNGTTGQVIKDGGPPVGGTATLTPVMFTNAALGFALGMLNGKIVTSVAANALTVAIKTLAGTDPTSTDVVEFFVTDGAGGWTPIKLTSALSLTVPAGATLGTVNNQAGRQWISVWNNAGTPVLGIYNSLNSSTPSVLCWDETSAANGTGITSGSTSPQIWYTASTLASKFFRVIGSVESTQATAGQWASAVTPKLFGPGSKKPGDLIQEPSNPSTAASSTSSATFVAIGPTQAITLTSAANLVRVKGWGTIEVNVIGQTAFLQIVRGSTLIGLPQEWSLTTVAEPMFLTNYIEALDVPGSTSVTYGFQGKIAAASTLSWPPASTGVTIAVQEIQI